MRNIIILVARITELYIFKLLEVLKYLSFPSTVHFKNEQFKTIFYYLRPVSSNAYRIILQKIPKLPIRLYFALVITRLVA